MKLVSEKEFEDFIETKFIKNGFIKGNPKDYNKTFVIDEKLFWEFLENSQEKEILQLQKKFNYKELVYLKIDNFIKKNGILKLLRKGINIEGIHLKFMYEIPEPSSAKITKENYKKNRLSITRQIHTEAGQIPDIVIFLNGLPIITMELKKITKNQTVKDAIIQYKKRDIKDKLYNFARCIVHFAVDDDEIYMTTKLNKKDTFFLPFNKGNNNSKGNPANPNGYKTSYLWEDILGKDSLLEIIQDFVILEDENKNISLSKKNIIFPRYHQLDVVRKVIQDISKNGVGKSYLIQHSAGSGKSKSIIWSAYKLVKVYKEDEKPIFDSVIIVTDRKILDEQLREEAIGFNSSQNIVAPAFSSKELKEHLANNKKIIITTIQKFPFIVDELVDYSNKNFAIIIDEAHNSQDGSNHENLNIALGKEEFKELDTDSILEKIAENTKLKRNASYLAFTATPKNSTLTKFGVDNKKPFHVYSMKQAIEEGFILDVLQNYTTYNSFYEIIKTIDDNPVIKDKKAIKRMKQLVESHPKVISQKVDIIIEHFMENVIKAKKLKNKAKGMVVTENIETTIRYYQAIKQKLESLNNPFKVVIAFSGKINVDGVEYSEESLNGFKSKDIKKRFDSDEYRLLVVANKFLTGFDQPKLCSMYVDKKLQDILCVQTFSRLNRIAPKLNKKLQDLFILDFKNSVESVKASFEPYYKSTELESKIDISEFNELKALLDNANVYTKEDVQNFIEEYLKNSKNEQDYIYFIDIVGEKFNKLEEDSKKDFKIKAKQFVKTYSRIKSILEAVNIEWEKLFRFLLLLIPKLKIQNGYESDEDILKFIDLNTYALQMGSSNEKIELSDKKGILEPENMNPRGVHNKEDEKEIYLDEIIEEFNEMWFSKFEDITIEESKTILIKSVEKIKKHKDFEIKYKNNNDTYTRDFIFAEICYDVIYEDRRKDKLDRILYKNYVQDDFFKNSFINTTKRFIEFSI